jgi:hypothetical protein
MVSAAPQLPFDGEEPDESLLVTEDDTPLDSILTEKQERLLTEPLYTSWPGPPLAEGGRARPFAALANVGLFVTAGEPPVVPDVMLSLDVTLPADLSQKKNRSYFMWRLGKPPEVVIEIVSNHRGEELGERRERYRRARVDFYVVYDPLKELGGETLQAFELRRGRYVTMDRPWFEEVGLGLVEWEGSFEGMRRRWLRWCASDGRLVQSGTERAETAEARAARLAERLRALGVDPDRDA